MNTIVKEISQKLEQFSDLKTKESGERFFKEKVKMHGVKTAIALNISKEYYKQVKGKTKEEVFTLCEELWQTGYMDESFIACNWSYNVHKDFEDKDIQIFERWINSYVNNWASCDTFCNHTVGEFIEMYPKYISTLKQWAKSDNRWMKRAAAVSLIIPARKGLFLNDVFEIADTLLLDPDDMVQKGYGWMLKVASNMHEKEVLDYVMKHKDNMPRTALRYAIEKMPKELKVEAMKK
jgi:3-methyladenine DNA glycosylase AlkD